MVDGETPMRLEIDSAYDWNEVRLKGSVIREMRFTKLPDTWGRAPNLHSSALNSPFPKQLLIDEKLPLGEHRLPWISSRNG
jgi:hypothetical protein